MQAYTLFPCNLVRSLRPFANPPGNPVIALRGARSCGKRAGFLDFPLRGKLLDGEAARARLSSPFVSAESLLLILEQRGKCCSTLNNARSSLVGAFKVGRRLPRAPAHYYRRSVHRLQWASALTQLFAFNVDRYLIQRVSPETRAAGCSTVPWACRHCL